MFGHDWTPHTQLLVLLVLDHQRVLNPVELLAKCTDLVLGVLALVRELVDFGFVFDLDRDEIW